LAGDLEHENPRLLACELRTRRASYPTPLATRKGTRWPLAARSWTRLTTCPQSEHRLTCSSASRRCSGVGRARAGSSATASSRIAIVVHRATETHRARGRAPGATVLDRVAHPGHPRRPSQLGHRGTAHEPELHWRGHCGRKMRVCAREGRRAPLARGPGAPHARGLPARGGRRGVASTHAASVQVHAAPFDVVDLDMSRWWREP